MEELLEQKIQRARELLATVRHAAMATVNEDGSPHNSPVQFQIDHEYKYMYWASNPESLHSRNLARTGQLFAVLYEPRTGGGLYMKAQNAHELSGDELLEGLKERNRQRAEQNRPPIDLEHYTGSTPQRMYRAELAGFWVNVSEKDSAGNVTNDHREEITREDLLA
jgi:hypothetical protein